MRQTYKIALSFMALATMALTGCQQQREMAPEEVAQAGSVAAQFSTPAITRVVSGTQWEGTEMIGISNTTKPDAKTTNVAYKATQSGATTNFTDQGTKLMLPGDNSTVNFAAYYPYASSVQSNVASYTINNGTNQPVLFATQSGTAQNPKLPFTFKHKLAQVKLVLTVEEGLKLTDLKSVVFKGGVTNVKMNILTGVLTTGTTKGDVTLKNEGNGTFSSYVVPQTFSDYSFAITLGDKSYTLKKEKVAQAPGEFKEGNSYTFKAKLTKDGKVVNPDGSKIDDMNDGGSSDGGDLTPDKPGTDEPTPDEPGTDEPAVDAKALPYAMDFANAGNFGDFTTFDGEGPQNWQVDTSKWKNGAKMTGYVNGQKNPNEDFLVSPAIDLTNATDPVLLINHAIKFAGNMPQDQQVAVSTDYDGGAEADRATWTPLTLDKYPAGNDWVYVDSKASLKQYVGKKIYIAFIYNSDQTNAATWQIHKMEVKENGGGSTVTPDPEPQPEPEPDPTPEPTPTTGNLLFPGADFENWDQFLSVNREGNTTLTVEQGTDNTQGGVIKLTGTDAKNRYAFTIQNTKISASDPTKLSFKVKGTSPSKSFSIIVFDEAGGTNIFNIGAIKGDVTITEFKTSTQEHNYVGEINTAGNWVTVTLDISKINIKKSGSGDLLAFKVGKESKYDVMVDDFKIE